ncbi:condensin subunit Smc [Lachnospiraceae bacterium NE2001]|nr:condensin subunit Smc [Lachnospiraceae bacterium NE2001]
MYLKSIEVNGFKSFANKIDFRFEEGITGIVGPNGSGKSNVADAVRWVLGEQSASKLRGSKMEDVIFAGTEQRKPQAAAYVAITLDNSDHSLPIDYNEVTVARRVYRSGESEYLINGTVSRLKDVSALFFDTGIGKEGYSIIGQGQIERILSDKPDDRRALFDEAAGIVKYKKNKQFTEKQLDQEHQNLNRVNDILSGLEERVEPLREQSEKAKIYLELKDRQKVLDINSFLIEVDKIRDKLDESKKNLEITEADTERLREEFDFTKAEYDRLEETLEQLSGKIESCQQIINEKKLENEHADGEIRVVNERISSEGVITAEINTQIERVRSKIADLDKEKSILIERKEQAEDQFKAESKNVEDLKKSVAKAEEAEDAVAAKIETAKSDILEFINAGGNLKEKIARYDTMLENISLRKTELKSKYLSEASEKSQAEAEKATLEEELSSVNETLEKDRAKLAKTESELRSVSDRATTVKSEMQKYNQTVISLQSRYESLRNLTERYEGYGQSIKKVMEKKTKNSKVIGVVADIISAPQEYETAIETALGASIQNIVTEDEHTAKDMIAYLRENKLGRATFLPITSVVKRGNVSPDALSERGVIGVASQLVKTDKKYQNIIDSLLGRSIVVDNIDNAIKISKKYNQSLRLVTPTGELINPGGAMTGGAFRNSSNLLGRKRELEDIQQQIGETNNKLRKSREEDANLTMKRETLREERTNLMSRIQKLSIDQNSVSIGLSNVNEKLIAIEQTFVSIKKENTELDSQIETIDTNKKELFDTGKQHENSITERESTIAKLEIELSKKNDLKHAEEDKLSQATLSLEGDKNRLDHLVEDIKRYQSEIEQYNEDISSFEERLENNSDNVKNLEKELKDLEASKTKNNELISKEAEKLTAYIQEKDDINKNHKDFFGKREKLSADINGLEKAAYSLKLNIEKLEEEKDKASNYMWEEYELTYSSAEQLKTEDYDDPAALKKEMNAVKQKIRGLGDVNVNAIEEYKEVSERYEFLKGQHDDIIEAENNLRSIIADLDKAMKETFAEKFQDIQVMFNKVFKELFGGGKASLILVDEEDLLETGIIINAQPPGKKLQNMMQLSGGEKSLTAISLLFAIQSLKPSPFCLLDEIEAALDDSNVSRFAKYLDKLTKHTQFIVITHRKGTMEQTNRLYGITMQEKGVSTLVSVDLIEDKLDD